MRKKIYLMLIVTSLLLISMNNNNNSLPTAEDTKVVSFIPSGWSEKMTISISNPPSIPNYQLKVELNSSFFDYAEADAAGADIRFEDNSGTSLSYYIESWNTLGTSTIWVRLSEAATPFIEMYYGNPLAESESNGEETFEFFDEFSGTSLNMTKWTAEDDVYSTYEIIDGYLRLNTDTPNDFTGYALLGFSDLTMTHGQPSSTVIGEIVAIGSQPLRYALTAKDSYSSFTKTPYHVPQQAWFTNEIRWYSDSLVEFENETHIASHTTSVPVVPLKIILATRAAEAGPGNEYGNIVRSHDYIGEFGYALKSRSWHHISLSGHPQPGGELRVDWIFQRKLVEIEPTLTYNYEPDENPPLISGPVDFSIETGSTGSEINWTLADENPDYYEIYRNDILLVTDTWESFDIISVDLDYLAEGIYNYSIIAYDTYENHETDTVIVTVGQPEETSYPKFIGVLLILGVSALSTIFTRLRRSNLK